MKKIWRDSLIFIATVFCLGVSFPLQADVRVDYSVDLSDTATWSDQKIPYDSETGALVPARRIYGFASANSGPHNLNVNVGDGRHGVFDSSTYSTFDTDGDMSNSTIVIDTENYPEGLQVTSFNLEAGYTLEPTGSEPLVIRSMGDVTIAGTIDCSGEDGENSSSGDAVSAGGQGRCSGGDGGSGGSFSTNPTAGTSHSGSIGGGQVLTTGNGAGGGGGGAYHFFGEDSAQPGEDPAGGSGDGDGGSAGTSIDDTVNDSGANLTAVVGGAGGGGGDVNSSTASGGGGGAGGGSVWIVALSDISLSGSVLVNGGNGGGDNAVNAGGGGGGAGGSIVLISGQDLTFTGVADAREGQGGSQGNASYLGGNGADGRVFMTDKGQSPQFAGTTEDPLSFQNVTSPPGGDYLGDVNARQTGDDSMYATSKVIDTQSSKPILRAVNVTKTESASNTVAIMMDSGDTSSFTPSWQTASSLVDQELGRFVKVQVILRNTDYTDTPQATLSALELSIDTPFVKEFELEGGCGRTQTQGWTWGHGSLLLLPLIVWMSLRRRLKFEMKLKA